MDKNLLVRLIVADSSFLTLREKLLFFKYLLDSIDSFESDSEFVDFINSLTVDSISFCVKRVFKRVKWNGTDALKKVTVAARILHNFEISWTCYDSTDFPAMLRLIPDPPFMLFYRGNLEILKRRCVSVVGTRRAAFSALKAASDFSKNACDDGLCVVSGLAFGIDAASHKGALLSSNPATCAVLPSGIDMITPQTHTRLAVKILESGGLILSEYLPGTPSVQFRYVQRNRIVAALSPVTLVVQAPAGSGAMITADLALGYNREVFFHSECFSRSIPAKEGKADSSSPKSFVEDGAKVISNYEEFKKLI
ncbi:DNA-processing protein DprA [uncultured Treponema sp.]|uniref:DNA-processing protein DprA n=1 Tax=uncultured Treponema sp. TaxID=162155 RepID=UPI0025E527CE|nr:DNA-processing protein DprA [uncultured Treponema sp.]